MSAFSATVDQGRSLRRFAESAGLSVGAHAFVLLVLASANPLARDGSSGVVEMDILETVRPAPGPPAPAPEPPKAAPAQRRRVIPSKAVAPPHPDEELAPPPPNQPAPEEKPATIFVGISMSSTTVAGAFAAPVGNTLYGQAPTVAPNPDEVTPYAAKKYAPPHLVTEMPAMEREVKIPYPEEAKRAGVEGAVVMRISIDETGNVTAARVVRGLGFGLDEAAAEAMKRCRFRPARYRGEAVGTDFTWSYRFELE